MRLPIILDNCFLISLTVTANNLSLKNAMSANKTDNNLTGLAMPVNDIAHNLRYM